MHNPYPKAPAATPVTPARRNIFSRLRASMSSGSFFEDILIRDSFIHPEMLTRY